MVLSWIYELAVRFVLWCYRLKIFSSQALSKPVISIGNITLGGVGKTPCVVWLAGFLKERQLKPAVLIRGYMEHGDDKGNSDEAKLLKSQFGDVPIAIGRDRVQKAKDILANNTVDCFILDDGFQHWRLKRDLDIVLIDATNPFGNGKLLPRGILRELPDSLKRAEVIVLTKTSFAKENVYALKERLLEINPACLIAEAVHRPVNVVDVRHNQTYEMSFLKGKRVCSLCAIGDPKSFESSLLQSGAHIIKSFAFMDHHRYSDVDIKKVCDYCRQNGITDIITTQKDAIKLNDFQKDFSNGFNLLVLKIAFELRNGKNEIQSRISHLLNR